LTYLGARPAVFWMRLPLERSQRDTCANALGAEGRQAAFSDFGLATRRSRTPAMAAGVFSTLRGREPQSPAPVGGFPDDPFVRIQAEEGWEFARAEAGADACGHIVVGHFA
jgi:hypothetical protein